MYEVSFKWYTQQYRTTKHNSGICIPEFTIFENVSAVIAFKTNFCLFRIYGNFEPSFPLSLYYEPNC